MKFINQKGWVKKMIGIILLALCLLYGLFAAYAYFFADYCMFRPTPAGYVDSVSIIKIKTKNNTKISAVYLDNPKAEYLLLVNHGNRRDIGELSSFLKDFQRHNLSVFSYDYEGYGTSEGKSTEKNVYLDADAAIDYVTKDLKVPFNKIIIFGVSLGGGAATYLAQRYPVAGLVLQSAFVSAFRVKTHFPLLPFDRFPNLKRIAAIHCPVYIIHGDADTIVPIWHGKALFKQANEPKSFFWAPGASHMDVIEIVQEGYWKKLQEFVDSLSQRSSR